MFSTHVSNNEACRCVTTEDGLVTSGIILLKLNVNNKSAIYIVPSYTDERNTCL